MNKLTDSFINTLRDLEWESHEEVAEALVAAVRESVPSPFWTGPNDNTGNFKSEGPFHYFTLYQNSVGTFTLDDGWGVHELISVQGAEELAHKLLKDRVMLVLGGSDDI